MCSPILHVLIKQNFRFRTEIHDAKSISNIDISLHNLIQATSDCYIRLYRKSHFVTLIQYSKVTPESERSQLTANNELAYPQR
jgi:hypothetical protein